MKRICNLVFLILIIVSLTFITGFRDLTPAEIISKMNDYYSGSALGKIKTTIISTINYDEDWNIVSRAKRYSKIPDKVRYELEHIKSGNKCIFIANEGKRWNNCPQSRPFRVNMRILRIISDLYSFSAVSGVAKTQITAKKAKIDKINYYLVSYELPMGEHRDQKLKVNMYILPSTFECSKIEIFVFVAPSWKKTVELELLTVPMKKRGFEGLKKISEIVGYLYIPEGKRKITIIVDSIEINKAINDEIFKIPVE